MTPASNTPLNRQDAEFYVRAAFRGLLGREPDPVALEHFSGVILHSGDPLAPVRDILDSAEYRGRKASDGSVTARLQKQSVVAAPDMSLGGRIRRRLRRELGVPSAAPDLSLWSAQAAMLATWMAQLSHDAATRQFVAELPQPAPFDPKPLLDGFAAESAKLEQQLQRQRKEQMAVASRLLSMEEEMATLRSQMPPPAPEATPAPPPPPPPLVHIQVLEDAQLHLSEGPYGRFLTIIPDLVGGAIERGEFWDAHLKPIIERYADPTRTAIDAGGYIGFHTVFLSRHFKNVVSFEPQARLFRLLNANVELNGCRNVRTYNAPLYDREIEMDLAADEFQQIPVPKQDGQVDYAAIGNAAALSFMPAQNAAGSAALKSMTIDSLGLTDVGFIKVDTQGCDLRVLQGGRATIAACRPVIALEFEQALAANQGDSLEDFQRFFAELNYEMTETAHSGIAQWDYLATPR